MSSERIQRGWCFSCDECGETTDREGADLGEAWRGAQDEGWRAMHVGERVWEHRCAQCAQTGGRG